MAYVLAACLILYFVALVAFLFWLPMELSGTIWETVCTVIGLVLVLVPMWFGLAQHIQQGIDDRQKVQEQWGTVPAIEVEKE